MFSTPHDPVRGTSIHIYITHRDKIRPRACREAGNFMVDSRHGTLSRIQTLLAGRRSVYTSPSTVNATWEMEHLVSRYVRVIARSLSINTPPPRRQQCTRLPRETRAVSEDQDPVRGASIHIYITHHDTILPRACKEAGSFMLHYKARRLAGRRSVYTNTSGINAS